jgi:very-short-patch-repair endonuclease
MKIHYNLKLTELARNLRNNMTFAEKTMWRELKGNKFAGYDFHRQKPIGNYIADFYCSKLKLVIEVDGITHTDENVKQNDRNKDEYFASLGLHILRFTDDEVIGNWDLIIKKLLSFIATHPPTPSL